MIAAPDLARPPLTEVERVRLAARADTPAETIHALATDCSVTVRAALAMNPARAEGSPTLATDPNERIRVLLAHKLARLLPGLSTPERADALAQAHAALRTLAQDAAARVRRALADAVASLPELPHDVALKLAHDLDAAVSDPVIRLSPLLTDGDLLALFAAPPRPGVAASVANRPGLPQAVADAVAASADSAAVRALLANRSAVLREATLDALVDRAHAHADWHAPFIDRPRLTAHGVSTLSRIVSHSLLQTLLARPDLPPALADALRDRAALLLHPPEPPPTPRAASRSDTESALLEALAVANMPRAAALLAAASRAGTAIVSRAISLRSAKALASLAWRAGWSADTSYATQTALGTLAPGEALHPRADATHPLSQAEMEWQLELLGLAPGQR